MIIYKVMDVFLYHIMIYSVILREWEYYYMKLKMLALLNMNNRKKTKNLEQDVHQEMNTH